MIIGIAGGSCSGKSSIAVALAGMIRGRPVFILGLDSYYLDLRDLSPEARALHNFDEPASLDIPLLVGNLKGLAAGEEVPIPVYDFETHTRLPEESWTRVSVDGDAVIIVEGLFTLSLPGLLELLDLKVFVEASHEVCLDRRLARDVAERGRTPESVRGQYEKTVRPMFDLHVLPGREFADVVVEGEGPVEKSASKIFELIGRKQDR